MIRMSDLALPDPARRASDLEAVARVLDSGRLVLDSEVKAFEAAWAGACGAAEAVGVANGMDAIEISLRALGIGSGDEVITSAMSAFATVLAILRAGATPVLADIDPDTALMDPASTRRCLSPRTRAIVPVHLYGQVRDMRAWRGMCRDAGLAMVEDCAQAHLAMEGDTRAGRFGELGAFSFYPTKNLGAAGDAGAIVTDDPALAKRCRTLRDYGQREKYVHAVAGLNSRLDEIQAAILRGRLPMLRDATARRRRNAERYHAGIDDRHGVRPLSPPVTPDSHVHHLFVVRCPGRRDELAAFLAARGVETAVHYPLPLHRQPAAAGLRLDPDGLPVAEAHARDCLSLPCHPALSDADVDAVLAALSAFR